MFLSVSSYYSTAGICFHHCQSWHLEVTHLLHICHQWVNLIPIRILDCRSVAMAPFNPRIIPPLFQLHYQVLENNPPNYMQEYIYHSTKTWNNNLLCHLMGVVQHYPHSYIFGCWWLLDLEKSVPLTWVLRVSTVHLHVTW